MIIATRHGIFLITNTLEFGEIGDEDELAYDISDFGIQLRSPSASDLMGLIESFPDQCSDCVIQEVNYLEMPSFRFGVEMEPEDWVNLLARLGAGVTYPSFTDEVKQLSDEGFVDSGLVTLILNLKVLMMQIYSRMFGPFDSRTIN